MSTTSPHVVETSEATFERDVLERSKELPVVVDFWAAWCAPCRRLGPVLEALADEYAGKFVLVKADADQCPAVAGSFGVRSLPTVFAVKDGAIVDGFMGALPESDIRVFLDRLMPTPLETLVAEGRALEATDPAAAEAKYRAVLESSPNDEKALTALAGVLLTLGRVEDCEKTLQHLERRGPLGDEAERIKARLVLRGGAEDAGDIASCRAALAAAPGDRALQFRLAEALAAAGQTVEALDLCLVLVEEDRKGKGEDARKLMLAIFQTLPDDSELLGQYRRKLSFVL